MPLQEQRASERGCENLPDTALRCGAVHRSQHKTASKDQLTVTLHMEERCR